jgi:uncharacterized protein (TIGR03435 family)
MMLAAVTFLTLVSAFRQAPAPPTFEVASVRPTLPGDGRSYIKGGPGRSDPERFTAVNVSLLGLVEYAFKLKPHQYAFPKLQWIDDLYFDIAANVPAGVSDEAFHVMLQNLLIERFGVKFHWESRIMPAYELTVGKSGSKLTSSSTTPDQPAPAFRENTIGPDGFPVLPKGNKGITLVGPGGKVVIRGRQETLDEIARKLSYDVGRPVVNLTALKGQFDYVYYYQMTGAPSGDMAFTRGAEQGPDLLEAVQHQLGLKLEPKKAPVPMFVIDEANKAPTEN